MAEGLAEDPNRAEERQQHRAPPDSVGYVVRVAVPQHDVEPVGQHREERKERDEDDDQIKHAGTCFINTVLSLRGAVFRDEAISSRLNLRSAGLLRYARNDRLLSLPPITTSVD